MLKKTITFTDFNGVERTEDFYFNLTKAEVAIMETSTAGGWGEHLRTIVAEQDPKKIVDAFRYLIAKAYGKKSPDGRQFLKSQEILDSFEQTEAYSELFMELVTNPEAPAAFVNGIFPQIPT